MMVQTGAVCVVGVAVAAQMFLKVQAIATNKCYQPILFQTQRLHLCGPTVLCNLVSSVKFNIAVVFCPIQHILEPL